LIQATHSVLANSETEDCTEPLVKLFAHLLKDKERLLTFNEVIGEYK
jgi:hypothetical protein